MSARKLSKNKRDKSREKLLEHLSKNCQGASYKPKKLAELGDAIAADYFDYLKMKKELERLKICKNN